MEGIVTYYPLGMPAILLITLPEVILYLRFLFCRGIRKMARRLPLTRLLV